MKTTRFVSKTPGETEQIAADLATRIPTGSVIALSGPLGSGKTVFVRGFAAACGVSATVSSPTYTLIHEYPGSRTIFHIDLYRLETVDAVESLDLAACWEQESLTLIEWAERATGLLPENTIYITLSQGEKPQWRAILLEEPMLQPDRKGQP